MNNTGSSIADNFSSSRVRHNLSLSDLSNQLQNTPILKKIILTLLFVGVVIASIVIITKNTSGTQSIPVETTVWEIYTDMENGYSVSYPIYFFKKQSEISGWLELIPFDNNSVSRDLGIRVAAYRYMNNKTLDEYMKGDTESKIYSYATNKTATEVGGLQGLRLYIESPSEYPKRTYRYEALVSKDNYIYSIQLISTKKESLVVNEKLFEKLVASFKFTDKP